MCGITGKLYFTTAKTLSEEDIHRMNERIRHRGPDDEGIYINPRHTVGLGHRRLSIIDLTPTGHQPMCNEDQTVWIIFNGEIYNFQDLRPALEAKGHRFRSHTDTEVILHLWEEYQEDCLQYLRGMFAFALWDEKRQKLFLARDRLGKKPLKYYIGKNFFVFASELKAFIDEPEIPKEMDFEAIHYFLTQQYVPSPLTGFHQIKKLPPACFLTVDVSGDRPKIRGPIRYWSLDYSKKLSLSEQEWGERILNKLSESVKLRMISDVPLGAFLSGGVDSSAIVGLMAQNSSRPIKTFSIGFKEARFSELAYARMVAERYQTDHCEFIVEPHAIDVIHDLARLYEEPYADSSALPMYYLAQMTRQHVTVALNGDGGDENFAGYPWYPVVLFGMKYHYFTPQMIQRLMAKSSTFAYHFHPTKFMRYSALFARAASKGPHVLHNELQAYFNEEEKNAMLTEEFQHNTKKFSDPSHLLQPFYQDATVKNVIDRALDADVHTYLPDDLLVKVDIATMAHGLESRSPFLDHELMELTAKMPASLKTHGHQGKVLLKKILEPMLPHELLYRKKQGFSIPIDEWFRTSLHNRASDILLRKNNFITSIIKSQALEQLLLEQKRGMKHGNRLWAALMLETWHQTFFKQS